MHAGGVVIGEKPLVDYVPIFSGANGELVTQFDKDKVESAGLVKFDFLGLKTLDVIERAQTLVNEKLQRQFVDRRSACRSRSKTSSSRPRRRLQKTGFR